ncbi:MAG: S9 family peptidase [Dehalococcoidia bacterium]
MVERSTAPYGSWKSPITTDLITRGGVRLGEVRVDGDDLYWLEGRAAEAGRNVIVRRAGDGSVSDVTPEGFNVRTRVHEYGGGAYAVHNGVVFFSNWDDQRIYRRDPNGDIAPITPEPSIPAGDRYADGRIAPGGRFMVCVRERHFEDREAQNEIIAVPTDGGSEPRVIVTGHDFYSFPRISPDGTRIAWTAWNHPNMPWDGTELWQARLAQDGTVSEAEQVTGGMTESIFQPEWSPDGTLHFISDKTGWWNLYRLDGDGERGLCSIDAESGEPQWVFGQSTYCFLPDGRIVLKLTQHGEDRLTLLDPRLEVITGIQVGYTAIGSLGSRDNTVYMTAASSTEPPAVVELAESGATKIVRRSLDADVDATYISEPTAIDFPTSDDGVAHALYYAPVNPDFVAPEGELPPLIVISHGGPTGATSSSLSLGAQFWTSRGFAVVDVNYRGSTGYGRAYREMLKGRWGVVDTDDCINAAKHLVANGAADGERLAIRGGSAGGYTTLCALTFHDVFAAGASYYGVADAERLATDTHKFESRYLDGLIGPYPEKRDLYRQRSPIDYADRLSCPLIIFQGLEDKIVPPSQAEAMVEALRSKGLLFAYVPFEGEQHGFRRAENIRRSLEAELYFYGRIFGFQPADEIEPVEIENLGQGV